ncbi:MAG: DUF1801 domain-containing protein [Bacteroidales bacterium]|nr:DUF1801 domain-containing protein [Bacteroidales bacterium]
MELTSDPGVRLVFNSYPKSVKHQVIYLRTLVIKVASEVKGLEKLEETLKWGEPSYLTKNGSTLRIAWKDKSPEQFGIYFKYTSSLVPTFKSIYNDIFEFEETRAIVFKINDTIPEVELQHCIAMAFDRRAQQLN